MKRTVYLTRIVLFDFEFIIFYISILITLLIFQGGDPVTVRQPHRVYDLDEHVHSFIIASKFYEINRIRNIHL